MDLGWPQGITARRASGVIAPRRCPIENDLAGLKPNPILGSLRREVVSVTVPALQLDDVDLSDFAFWGRPPAEREAAFALLRAQARPVFYPEPETPLGPPGRGYYALVKHA